MSNKKRKGLNEPPARNPDGSSRVQPVSRLGGFGKLRALECFPEVHDRICKGWPLAQVASYIQDECGEYRDAEQVTLIKVLQNYRESLPSGERAQHVLPKSQRDAIEKIEEELDEIKALTKLYRRQEERLEIDGQVEKNIGKLLPTMTQEIRVTVEVLKTIAQLKMDMGIHTRHLGTVDVEARLLQEVDSKYEGTEVGTVLRDPKKRRRLLNIAEHALSLSKRNVEMDESDPYVPEPEGELVTDGD